LTEPGTTFLTVPVVGGIGGAARWADDRLAFGPSPDRGWSVVEVEDLVVIIRP
jgi:hypothetical protein